MATPIYAQSISQLSAALAAGELTSVALAEAVIARHQAVDGQVHAFNSGDEAVALAAATESDARRAAGQARGPLDGIPIALKDVIAMTGQPLTASSKMLANFVSPYDATATTKLKAAGAVLWGRTNTDEFAMGSSTENSAFGASCNPYALDHVPGGSSGGSAAAVASGQAIGALGSDTGGSIRQPAAFCNLVGLKPSYGRVSRYGLVAYASSLDQIGCFGRTVEDAAIMLGAIAGHDERDSTSLRETVPDYRAALANRGPWTLGVPREYFGEGLDPEVAAAVEKAIDHYRGLGCTIKEVSLPHTRYGVSAYYIIATAECSSNLARMDGVRYGHRSAQATDAIDLYAKSRAEGFGAEVKRRIILGTYVLSSGYYDAYYLRAQKVRSLIRQDFINAFVGVDAILTPTSPTPAFKQGEKSQDPLAMYLMDIYTIGVNLAGLPGVSVPCGFTDAGLPIGLQVIGQPFQEADMLAIAAAYERDHSWATRLPEL